MVLHHFHALIVDYLLETFVMEVGEWDLIDALRATECQRIMPMHLDLGINALHYVVIAKHSNYCRFCRAIPSCTPFTRLDHWSGIPLSESRSFDATQRALAWTRECASRKAVSEEKARQAAQSVDQHQVNDVDGR